MPLDMDRLTDTAVTTAALRRLPALGRVLPVAAGTPLAQEGDPVAAVYLVLSGRFLTSLRLGEDLVPVEEAVRGALLAFPDWCADRRHGGDILALAAGEVVRIDAEALTAAATEDADLALLLVGLLSMGLRRCIESTEAVRCRTVVQRTAAYLLALPPAARDGGLQVRLPMAKKLLAAHLGMTQQSLSRVLRLLRPAGVSVRGRLVAIEDRPGLSAVAEGLS